MWAAGIVLYMLLTGEHPFEEQEEINPEEDKKDDKEKKQAIEKIIQKIRKGEQVMSQLLDNSPVKMSQDAKDLIKALVCMDPDTRLSAEQALDHAWITSKPKHDWDTLIKKNLLSSNAVDNMMRRRNSKLVISSRYDIERVSLSVL